MIFESYFIFNNTVQQFLNILKIPQYKHFTIHVSVLAQMQIITVSQNLFYKTSSKQQKTTLAKKNLFTKLYVHIIKENNSLKLVLMFESEFTL